MSDWSKGHPCGELMTRNILRSSAKITNLQWLTELYRSLMNRLKRRATEQSIAAHRKLLKRVGKTVEVRTRDFPLINCETG